MLWLALHLAHLPIEARGTSEQEPLAITEGHGARRRLVDCNVAARRCQLVPGMDVPSALLRAPTLRLVERTPAEENGRLQALACRAHAYTSDVCVDAARWMLFLELGASLHYFDGLEKLLGAITQGLSQLGYTATHAVAPALEAAALLATAANAPVVLTLPALRAALGPLSLARLPLEPRWMEQLHASGLTTIASLIELPPAALARRFGPALPRYLRRLQGLESDPRVRHRIPPVYRRRCDFLDPLETLEALLFPTRRALQELEGYLRGRDVAIQHLTLTLRQRDADDLTLQLTTSSPQRAASNLFALVREKFERITFTGPVTQLLLLAQEFVPLTASQGDLFDDRRREQERWSVLLDTLRARLGGDAIRHLGLRDDHRPERAWCFGTEPNTTMLPAGLRARSPLVVAPPSPPPLRASHKT